MSRVRTFSKVFPSHHPRAGQPTEFEMKIWASLIMLDTDYYSELWFNNWHHYHHFTFDDICNAEPKHHTIRAGKHFKPGDKFSPRGWFGKPYKTKQYEFAPEMDVVKTWDFSIDEMGFIAINDVTPDLDKYHPRLDLVAINDGLATEDFIKWFTTSPAFKKYPEFNGQIICWNPLINYE